MPATAFKNATGCFKGQDHPVMSIIRMVFFTTALKRKKRQGLYGKVCLIQSIYSLYESLIDLH